MCMPKSYVRHNSFIVTCLIHVWDITHSYVWHDSFILEKCLIHMWDMPHSHVRHDSFIRDTQRIHTCVPGMPLCAIASVTWLIHMCDMTHSHVWHAHSYVWHDSFICVTWFIYVWRILTCLINTCDLKMPPCAVGLFWVYVGLFCVHVGLFWKYIGLYTCDLEMPARASPGTCDMTDSHVWLASFRCLCSVWQ